MAALWTEGASYCESSILLLIISQWFSLITLACSVISLFLNFFCGSKIALMKSVMLYGKRQ
jgi:hypothetical protein